MRLASLLLVVASGLLSACLTAGEGGTNFDESKIASIKSGVTTRDQVQALFGLPPHRNKVDAREVWVYSYTTSKNPNMAAGQGAAVVASVGGTLLGMVVPGAGLLAAVPATMAQGAAVKHETTSKTLTVSFNLGVVTSCSYAITKQMMALHDSTSDNETTNCGQAQAQKQ